MRRHDGYERAGPPRMPSNGRPWAWIAAGAALALVGSRLLPPLAGQAMDTARAALGRDPFDALARDHRRALALFDTIAATAPSATLRRSAMLLQLKRMLSAHALAEEDVVYPILSDMGHGDEAARQLYREHAEMKVRLHELERMAKDDPAWVDRLCALRHLIERHGHEEETQHFPALKRHLDRQGIARLSAEVQREKALLF